MTGPTQIDASPPRRRRRPSRDALPVALVAVLAIHLAGCVAGPEDLGLQTLEPPQPWPAPIAPRFISIDGVRLAITERGSGRRDIVLLSGLGGSTLDWQRVIRRMEPTARLIVVEWPGFGSSDRPPAHDRADRLPPALRTSHGPDRVGIAENARLIEPLLATLRVRPGAIVVGHSLGGHIAAYYASEPGVRGPASQNVAGLVLIAPSGMGQSMPNRRLDAIQRSRETVIDWATHFARWTRFLEKLSPGEHLLLSVATSDETVILDREQKPIRHYMDVLGDGLSRLSETREAEGFVTAAADNAISLRNTPMDERLHRIEWPTLVIGGLADLVIPPPATKQFALGIRDAGLLAIDDVGHVPAIEAPPIVAAGLDRFLAVTAQPAAGRPIFPPRQAATSTQAVELRAVRIEVSDNIDAARQKVARLMPLSGD